MTYSHRQELFYKFVSNFTNKLVKQLLSTTVYVHSRIYFHLWQAKSLKTLQKYLDTLRPFSALEVLHDDADFPVRSAWTQRGPFCSSNTWISDLTREDLK